MQRKFGFTIESENTPRPGHYRVLLIGESCKDVYRYGTCARICPEAPVPVFDFSQEEVRPGMVANVKENLQAFGIEVDFITNDPNQLIKRRFVDTKTNHLLLREDCEVLVDPLPVGNYQNYDAIVISDYCKGAIDYGTVSQMCSDFSGPIFVDSKNPDLSAFKNSIIKINNDEESKLFKVDESSELIVTMGKHGAKWKGRQYTSPPVDVFDVTGAGDVFLATLCYFYLHTKDLNQSIPKAVYLASKSVQHTGVYILTQQDISEAL